MQFFLKAGALQNARLGPPRRQTEPPGLAHDDPENSKRALWRAPALQSTRRRPERPLREKFQAGRGKKSAKFRAPTLLDATLRAPPHHLALTSFGGFCPLSSPFGSLCWCLCCYCLCCSCFGSPCCAIAVVCAASLLRVLLLPVAAVCGPPLKKPLLTIGPPLELRIQGSGWRVEGGGRDGFLSGF